jgi:PelA/Pel-15E family pectate lyase
MSPIHVRRCCIRSYTKLMNTRLVLRSLGLAALCTAIPLSAQETDNKVAPKITLRVEADYLALHASGTAPAGTSAAEHRLTLSGASAQPGPWTSVPVVAADGSFQFDVPLPEWRWARLEVRVMVNGQALTAVREKPSERAFTMLTPERMAALPETQRAAWHGYLENSMRHAAHERNVLAAECRKLGMASSRAAPLATAEFEFAGGTPAAWFGGAEALRIVPAVLSYQTPAGGWSKAVGYASGPRAPGTQWTNNAGNPWHYCGTLDNRSTTEQIRFLANVHAATNDSDAKAGALRGIEWLLAAQFPNGGWPQVYPVESGYHEAITLNDGAMQHAMELLLSVSKGEAPFAFADEALRQRAAASVAKGIACVVESQVKVDGKGTVWCAQHDPLTLAPVAARLKEPPSLSGAESADLLKFLMRKGPVTPSVIQTIQSGIDWLSAHRITNLRKTKNAEGKTDYVPDAASDEVYWARFYDVQTGQPIFAGAQDGIIYTTFHEMAQHNKVAYAYFTTKPTDVIGKEVDLWKKRVQTTAK